MNNIDYIMDPNTQQKYNLNTSKARSILENYKNNLLNLQIGGSNKYRFITNPRNNKRVLLNSKDGKQIIHNYLRYAKGGTGETQEEKELRRRAGIEKRRRQKEYNDRMRARSKKTSTRPKGPELSRSNRIHRDTGEIDRHHGLGISTRRPTARDMRTKEQVAKQRVTDCDKWLKDVKCGNKKECEDAIDKSEPNNCEWRAGSKMKSDIFKGKVCKDNLRPGNLGRSRNLILKTLSHKAINARPSPHIRNQLRTRCDNSKDVDDIGDEPSPPEDDVDNVDDNSNDEPSPPEDDVDNVDDNSNDEPSPPEDDVDNVDDNSDDEPPSGDDVESPSGDDDEPPSGDDVNNDDNIIIEDIEDDEIIEYNDDDDYDEDNNEDQDYDDDKDNEGNTDATDSKTDNRIRELFRYFDTDNSAYLDWKQLSAFFQIFQLINQTEGDKKAKKVIEKGAVDINKFRTIYHNGYTNIDNDREEYSNKSKFMLKNICKDIINPNHISLIEIINELIQHGEIDFYLNKMEFDLAERLKLDTEEEDDIDFLKNKIKEHGKKAINLDKPRGYRRPEHHNSICNIIIENYKMAIVAGFIILTYDENYCNTILEKKIAGYAVRIDQLRRKQYEYPDTVSMESESPVSKASHKGMVKWNNEDYGEGRYTDVLQSRLKKVQKLIRREQEARED